MFIDTNVIARQSAQAGGLEVLGQRHEVMWRDGSSVQLHPVHRGGRPMTMLRAVEAAGGHMLLVDLTRLVRRLDAELRATPERDVAGHVFYTLREAFASAPTFMAAVQRHACGTWWPVSNGHVWQPAARAMDGQALAATAAAVMAGQGAAC